MVRVVVEYPLSLRASHDIQVIEIVAVRRTYRVVAFGHHDDIVVRHGHGFVQAAIIGINALKRESLGWIDTVVIGLFETRFLRPAISIMLVWGITGPIAARRQDLADQQALGARIAKKDVANMPAIRTLPARLVLAVFRLDQPGGIPAFGRCPANRKLKVGVGLDDEILIWRNVHRVGCVLVEYRCPLAEVPPGFVLGADAGLTGKDNEADFGAAAGVLQAHAFLELESLKSHIFPARRFGIDALNAPSFIGHCGLRQQFRHVFGLLPR